MVFEGTVLPDDWRTVVIAPSYKGIKGRRLNATTIEVSSDWKVGFKKYMWESWQSSQSDRGTS